jgi:hypothetical protein
MKYIGNQNKWTISATEIPIPKIQNEWTIIPHPATESRDDGTWGVGKKLGDLATRYMVNEAAKEDDAGKSLLIN